MNELSPKQHGCYAHIPGTGPQGMTCYQCEHCKPKASRTGGVTRYLCSKWTEIKRAMGDPKPNAKPIISSTPSCKYFERRTKTPAAGLLECAELLQAREGGQWVPSDKVIPDGAPALVREFLELLNQRSISWRDFSTESGLSQCTARRWGANKRGPTLLIFERALRALGFRLIIVPIESKRREQEARP